MVTFHLHDRGASCTLDDQAAAQRNAEFADVIERGLRHRGRTPEGVVRLVFVNKEGMESEIRALAVRESECCGFFSFDVDVRDDDIVLEVAASDGKINYLDELYRATDPERDVEPARGSGWALSGGGTRDPSGRARSWRARSSTPGLWSKASALVGD